MWRVLERHRLGPFRYPISFGATLTRTGDTSFRSDVRAAPGFRLLPEAFG